MVHGYICSKLPKEFRKVFEELFYCFLSTLYFHALFMLLISEVFFWKFWKSSWPLRRKHLQFRILLRVDFFFSLCWSFQFLYFRATAFDFCKVKRGKDGGTLRTMSGEKLLKTLPVLQAQVLDWYSVLSFAISGIVVLYSGSSCQCFVHLGWCTVGVWLFSTRPQQRGYQL